MATTFIGKGILDPVSFALDESGNVYITGETWSQFYPTTPSAYDESRNDKSDLFISKLDGNLSAEDSSTTTTTTTTVVSNITTIASRTTTTITPGHSGSGRAFVGVEYEWDLREYTCNEVKDWPVKLIADYSYRTMAYWFPVLHGSAMAWIRLYPGPKFEEGYVSIGSPSGKGIHSSTVSVRYQTTVEGLAARRIYLEAFSHASSGSDRTPTHLSSAQIQFSSIRIEFPCPAEQTYGEDSEKTELLRYLRDNVLSNTSEDWELIKLYCQWSPLIIKEMEEDEEFKEKVKEMIDVILPLIESRIE